MEKPNMYYNFDLLIDRVLDTLDKTNLLEIKQKLEMIKTPTLVSGVGGSSVVSNYASKVLSIKNNVIATNIEPRDMNYINISNYNNILSCSYSGNNYGVDTSFNNNLNHYLLSSNRLDNVININYKSSIEEESSFISLAATLIPMSILLSYYLDNDISLIQDILNNTLEKINIKNNIYEVFTGYETSTASKYLDTTLVESGIGIPIIHDKYAFCHGRSTIGKDNYNNKIILNNDKELDKLLISLYEDITIIDRKYNDDIVNDYYITYMCMLFTKQIAEYNNLDLSRVNHSYVTKKLYRFKGEM